MNGKTALITGASSGIGYATAKLFAQAGINLVLCGRRKNKLDSLEQEIGSSCKVLKLCFDVRDRTLVFEQIGSLENEWQNIDFLINNAGNAHGLDFADEANLDDWEMMIDTNVKGLMYVTKAVLPYMLKRKKGHIINISSIAGKEVYPKGNVYCASKFAVDAFNNGLRIDLVDKGVKVSLINPGAVNTEFSTVRFKGDKTKANKVYEGFEPLVAKDIAELIYFVISRPPHVNISDTMILSTAQATASIIHKTNTH